MLRDCLSLSRVVPAQGAIAVPDRDPSGLVVDPANGSTIEGKAGPMPA